MYRNSNRKYKEKTQNICVFKPEGYNIMNAVLADRQVVTEMLSSVLAGWPPFSSANSQYAAFVRYTYMRAGESQGGHPTSRGSRCLNALALLPYSPATLSPYYLLFPP